MATWQQHRPLTQSRLIGFGVRVVSAAVAAYFVYDALFAFGDVTGAYAPVGVQFAASLTASTLILGWGQARVFWSGLAGALTFLVGGVIGLTYMLAIPAAVVIGLAYNFMPQIMAARQQQQNHPRQPTQPPDFDVKLPNIPNPFASVNLSGLRPRPNPNRRVFISYRRAVSWQITRAIYNELRAHGYDVFMDVESIPSGQFERIILNQIAARPHFIVILTHGTLDRVDQPGDWLRREIERALELERNIIPVLVDGFTMADAAPHLTGRLAALTKYNALDVPQVYFDAAMTRLRTQFLAQPAAGPVIDTPEDDRPDVERHQAAAAREAQSNTP